MCWTVLGLSIRSVLRFRDRLLRINLLRTVWTELAIRGVRKLFFVMISVLGRNLLEGFV